MERRREARTLGSEERPWLPLHITTGLQQFVPVEAPRRLYDELRNHYRGALGARVERSGASRGSRSWCWEVLLRLRQAACPPGLLDGRTRDRRERVERFQRRVILSTDRTPESPGASSR